MWHLEGIAILQSLKIIFWLLFIFKEVNYFPFLILKSYHNVRDKDAPHSKSTKPQLIKWLHDNNIDYSQLGSNPKVDELKTFCKIEHEKDPQYKINEIVAQYGHSVIRLPPYHPELNPIG